MSKWVFAGQGAFDGVRPGTIGSPAGGTPDPYRASKATSNPVMQTFEPHLKKKPPPGTRKTGFLSPLRPWRVTFDGDPSAWFVASWTRASDLRVRFEES